MTPAAVFSLVNSLALLTWLGLIVRPRHSRVLQWAGQVVPIFFGLIYVAIIVMRFGRTEGDFNSLAGVAALFRDPWILLAGWVHYLAFDLLTGVWEARDSAARNVPHWMLALCLLLTFMFGPAGWLLYLAVRSIPSLRQPSNKRDAASLL